MQISAENVDQVVNECWNSIQSDVESGKVLSSEKTLAFRFAMELFKRVGTKVWVDFEQNCYEDLSGSSRYLDLLFYTDDNFKVAVEFKFPRKTRNGGSNTTQTRSAVYRDIGRLNYLKTSPLNPSACYFLMAANEGTYINSGDYSISSDCITAHGHTVLASNMITVDGVTLNGIAFSFTWRNIEESSTKNRVAGRYAWLEPIRV